MTRITRAAGHLSVEEVKERMRNDPNAMYRERWLIIYNALVDPRPASEIAKHTGVSEATVHKLISRYNRLGIEAVETPGKGGRRHAYLSSAEEEQLLSSFTEQATRGEIVTITVIKQEYEKRVGQEVHETTIYRLLARHNWRKVMPRSYHPKAKKSKQEEFKQTLPEKVQEKFQTKSKEDKRPLLFMVQDEARFGRVNVPRHAWAPEKIRPLTPRQIVREYTYIYAAIAPKEGQMISLILPYSNTEMMNLFLPHVSENFSEYFIVMQVDQASWHCSLDLVIPENIRLIYQPAYSPELNPVEHLWEEVREKYLANRIFAHLDNVIEVLCDALVQLESEPDHLQSMTYFPHLQMVA